MTDEVYLNKKYIQTKQQMNKFVVLIMDTHKIKFVICTFAHLRISQKEQITNDK